MNFKLFAAIVHIRNRQAFNDDRLVFRRRNARRHRNLWRIVNRIYRNRRRRIRRRRRCAVRNLVTERDISTEVLSRRELPGRNRRDLVATRVGRRGVCRQHLIGKQLPVVSRVRIVISKHRIGGTLHAANPGRIGADLR